MKDFTVCVSGALVTLKVLADTEKQAIERAQMIILNSASADGTFPLASDAGQLRGNLSFPPFLAGQSSIRGSEELPELPEF